MMKLGQLFARKEPIPDEIAARGRAWRAANPLRPLDPDAVVSFAIPLIGRDRAGDWALVEANLEATLASLLRQSDPRWRAIICSQDCPKLPEDRRIAFLPFQEPPDVQNPIDKYRKIRVLKDHVASDGGDGYFFMLDADDILHPKLVEHMMETANPAGYILERGWMVDAATEETAILAPPTIFRRRSKPFHQHCGSCSAIRFDRRDGDTFLEPLAAKGKHGEQADRLTAFGLALAPIPFPAALYMMNHGENLRKRRGLMHTKLEYLRRHQVPADRAARIRAEFGI